MLHDRFRENTGLVVYFVDDIVVVTVTLKPILELSLLYFFPLLQNPRIHIFQGQALPTALRRKCY